MTNSKTTIKDLAKRIREAKQAYYLGHACMSDADYDALEDRLAALDPDHPVLSEIGAPLKGVLLEVHHGLPMGSLAKATNRTQIEHWIRPAIYHITPKIDGASIAAYYRAGHLRRVLTRGNGVIGEDITHQARDFRGLPVRLQEAFTGAVRLECVLPLDEWRELDPGRCSHPRALGTGIMRRHSGMDAGRLMCMALDLYTAGLDLPTEESVSLELERLGFTAPIYRLTKALDVETHALRLYQMAHPFAIDGVVIKIDDRRMQAKLGSVGGRPKGQIARKYPSATATTTLLDVEVTVGRTGQLTPVACLDPVRLAGTVVSRASLANWQEIKSLGVAYLSAVEVTKANEIIPKITRCTSTPRGAVPIEPPETCPECDKRIKRIGALHFCVNERCDAQALARVKHWAKVLRIKGLGDAVLRKAAPRVPSDLYEWTEASLAQAGVPRGVAKRLLAEIGATRHITLEDFLVASSLPGLGRAKVRRMIGKGSLTTIEQWVALEHDHPALAWAPHPKALVHVIGTRIGPEAPRLGSLGVTILRHDVGSDEGRIVCISGRLPSGATKDTYREPLRRAGYKLVDTLTKRVSYLVVCDTGTAKAKRAGSLGVRVIDESGLLDLVEAKAGAL